MMRHLCGVLISIVLLICGPILYAVDGALSTCAEKDRVYRFAIGENYGAYEYKDIDGYAKGFNIDLIRTICQTAGRECYYVMDRFDRCWAAGEEGEEAPGGEHPGEGLLGGWYDGCVGLFPSPGRLNAFNFSLPYTRASKAAIFHHKDTIINTTNGNTTNISGLKIGFITGWAVNQQCLSRQPFSGNQRGDYQPVMFHSNEDMVMSVMTKKIDAMLSSETINDNAEVLGLKQAGPSFHCTTAGSSMMARYGDPVIQWWNEAFLTMLQSGEYQRLCQRAKEIHGFRGAIDCFDDSDAPTVVSQPYQESTFAHRGQHYASHASKVRLIYSLVLLVTVLSML